MKSLIIAEKPSVAKDIAKALGVAPGAGGVYENDQLVISNAIGHLVEIAAPEAIAKQIPVLPDPFDLQPIDRTKEQLTKVVKLIRRDDIGTLINACDAGREGELIFRLIAAYAKSRKTVQRMWLQSMTPGAIRDGYKRLRTDADMQPLSEAAWARAEADWLVGINGSRLCKRLRGDTTPVGRVQTPTLMMVVAREEAIKTFVAKTYYEVRARFDLAAGGYDAKWYCPVDKVRSGEPPERLWDQAEANAILARCKGRNPDRIEEENTTSRSAAPVLFDLTTLQREANQKFGFSASKTLKIAQALYEKYKVLTYPRTDAKALPEDYVPTVTRTVEALGNQGYAAAARRILDNGWIKPTKKVFDNSKISDHFAIVPTGLEPKNLEADKGYTVEDLQKIYDLVAKRLLAVFHPDAVFAVTVRTAWIGEDRFVARGKVLVEAAWQSVYETQQEKVGKASKDDAEDKDGEQLAKLPPLAVGEQGRTGEMKVANDETKSPRRYNEATLLSAMEHAGKEVTDEALRAAMAKKGLGTPATRAATIEGLLASGYMTREKRNLVPTQLAFELKALLVKMGAEALLSPELTGDWEAKLKSIEQRQASRSDFLGEIKGFTLGLVERSAKIEPQAPSGPSVTCSSCGKPMSRRKSAKGFFWGCTGYPDCKSTLPDDNGKPGAPRAAAASAGDTPGVKIPCPKCGQPLRRREGPKGPFWGCSAYPACKATLPDDNGKPGVRAEDVAGKSTRAEVQALTVPPKRNAAPADAGAQTTGSTAAAPKAAPPKANESPIGKKCPGCGIGTLTLKAAPQSKRPYAGCTEFPACKYFLWMDKKS